MKLLGEWMVQDPKSKKWSDAGLGFVEARPNPYNTREYMAKLTVKGYEVMQDVDKALG